VEPAHRRSRRGDGERSFERLYRRHRTDVYRALLRELGNREDAEDVMQTAFLDAYRALARGGRPERPRAWLLTIAENARRRRFRAQRRGPEQASLEYEPTAEEAEVTAGELRDALERLPPNQRAALVLREVGGLSYAEIADRLALSVPAVQMLLFRARRALRSELEGEGVRRGLPAWPVPPWLPGGLSSPGGSLGVLPRAAGLVAAGAMGAAVVAGTASLRGPRADQEPQRARTTPSAIVADPATRRRTTPARPSSPSRAPASAAAPKPSPASPPRSGRPAPAPAPPAAASSPAAPVPLDAPSRPVLPGAVPVPEIPFAGPLLPPPVEVPVPPPLLPPPPVLPEPAVPALPPEPQLPAATTPVPVAPVPAPPAGTGESGGAAIPALRPS
jgi:RNA polymerase sigma-70 factor (ECF subfamily)